MSAPRRNAFPFRVPLFRRTAFASIAAASACALGCGAASGLDSVLEPDRDGSVACTPTRDGGEPPGLADSAPWTADDSASPGDAASTADGETIPAPPPPWEIDGGSGLGAACAGLTLDSGACLVTLASGQPNPWGVAIDDTSVYWTNGGAGSTSSASIAKVGRSGGTPTTLASGLYEARGIAVDGKSVYWDGHAIQSVGLDGGTPFTIFDDYNSVTSFVTRAGGRVYWANSNYDYGLRSALPDGSGYTKVTGFVSIGGLAASAVGIVFSQSPSSGPGEIDSATLGGSITTLLAGALGPVKSAGDVVIYTDDLRTMYEIPLRGGPPSFLASGAYPADLVTDGTFVYWTDQDLRAVMKLGLAEGAPIVLVSHQDDADVSGTGSLTIDSSSVYFTEPGGCSEAGVCVGQVLKLTPR